MKSLILFISSLLFVLVSFPPLKAEKLIETNIKKQEWYRIRSQFPHAHIENVTQDGYVILLTENTEIEKLIKSGYSVKIIEDLDEKKRLYYSAKSEYHTFSEFVDLYDSLAQAHPDIAILDTIGYSVEGRPILVMKISDNPDKQEPEPEVRIVGTHHGNEWISTEIPILLTKWLLDNYGVNDTATYLVNNREIYIMPIFNPDGHVDQTRYNANGIDLNRNYGYMWNGAGGDTEPYGQPETQAMYEFSQKHNFLLSLSFHSYGEVVNYIWNYTPVRTADDRYNNLIYQYSEDYASYNNYWVTEGYDWYQTRGDLNDYSYGIDGDIDWTIELGSEFIPPASAIDSIWLENKPAILDLIKKSGQGIAGFVIDSITGDTIKEARITVYPVDWPIWTDRTTGDFMRPLLPGTYSIKVEANGYISKTINNIVVHQDTLTWLDVYLSQDPQGAKYAFKPVSVVIYASNYSRITVDTFMTHYMLGAPDGKFVYLGVGGWVVLDMGEDSPAEGLLTIYEEDDGNTGEGYTVYASNNWRTGWQLVGNGNGTQTFNLAGSFRYIKIVDDGDGDNSLPNCGFDLDAVESYAPNEVFLTISSYEIHDSQGDNDGKLDPGESGFMLFTLKNLGQTTAYDVSVHPYVNDSYLNIPDTTFTLIQLSGCATYTDSFSIQADSGSPRGYETNIFFSLVATGYSSTDSIQLQIGERGPDTPQGPDLYGYYAYDNADSFYTEWEPYNWFEIENLGENLSISTEDDRALTISLPFTFKFYGIDYNQITICTNGWIAMGSTSETDWNNNPIPSSSNPPALIAPFFDDLSPAINGDIYIYYDDTGDAFVIEWKNVYHWGLSVPESFEIILRDPMIYPTTTGDGEIIFQYQTVSDPSSCTVGIEKPDHSAGLQYVYNQTYDSTASLPLAAGHIIKFTTDPPEITSITENKLNSRNKLFYISNVIKSNVMRINFSEKLKLPAKYTVYNIQGRKIQLGKIEAGKKTAYIKLRNLPQGIYFLKVKVDSKTRTEKFIKIGK